MSGRSVVFLLQRGEPSTRDEYSSSSRLVVADDGWSVRRDDSVDVAWFGVAHFDVLVVAGVLSFLALTLKE